MGSTPSFIFFVYNLKATKVKEEQSKKKQQYKQEQKMKANKKTHEKKREIIE
jgi:hypothetical protein